MSEGPMIAEKKRSKAAKGAAVQAEPGANEQANAMADVPAFYARRKKRHNELCQILIRSGAVKPEHVRKALAVQEERGGQIGRILVKMGACSDRAIAQALAEQVRLLHHAKGAENLSDLARKNPGLAGLDVACSPPLTSAALVASDLFVFAVLAALAASADYLFSGSVSREVTHYGFAPLACCVVVFATQGAYAAAGTNPVEEIRRTTMAVSLVFLGDALVTAFGSDWGLIPAHLHVVFFFEWLLSALFIPIMRSVTRSTFARSRWWGVPVVVLGAGVTGRKLVRALRMGPSIGLRPVLILDDDIRKHGTLRASLNDADEIAVNSVRDVAVHSVQRVDALSSRDVSTALGRIDMARGIVTTDGSAPSSRSPSSWPPSAERFASSRPPPPLDGPERDSMFEAAAKLPTSWSSLQAAIPAPPDTGSRLPPSSAGAPMSRRDRVADSGRMADMPESIRGIARGQFAEVEGVPVIGGLELAPLLSQRLGISYAIVAMPGQKSRKLLAIMERVGGAFSHLLVIPDLIGLASMGVPAKDVGGVVGIEVRQQLLLPGPRFAKRLMDVSFTLLGGIFVLPVVTLLAILIRLDSKGPAFYVQKRMGRDGNQFIAYKFRSMHGDGESRLKAVLEADPKLRAEYDEFHKLSFDPRVTRIGRIIRKYSLDELPQLWNVVKGDMSLVGPRPYLEREVPDMGQKEGIILRAMPGLTGLWQVSDRNSTGFAERLKMDVHYVRNWSPWLDLYVLARTVGVVIAGTGS